uniref:Receptor-type tyrosine-protein phosphatase zeta n=1 Tax=Latimeria chalumnae TaxID=7897 RepID=H2ZXN2_LATCH
FHRQHSKNKEQKFWISTGPLDQKNWGRKYPTCNGAKQSPINIDDDLTQVNVNFRKLKFEGWEEESSENTFIHNNGKTVEINLTNEYYVSGGGLISRFKASRITFHWGKCNASSDGSEHSLDGRKFPLEMQIYCYDVDHVNTFDEAMKGHGKIKALSILFEIGVNDNSDYDAIISGVNSVSRFGKRAQLEPFVLFSLLPNSTEKYYTYNGSFTTPPCTEMVEWIVFKDTVTLSKSQLEVFCEILTMQKSGYVMVMDYVQNNFREQQYQFVGQVLSSYTGSEEIHEPVCSSEPENVQADPKNYTDMIVIWERPRVVYDAVIENYAVFYQQLVGEDQSKHEILTDGDQDTGAILNNLLPNTSYVIQVVAVCANGLYGRRSDQLIVDMPLDDPAEIDPFSDLNETEDISNEMQVMFKKEEETALDPEISASSETGLTEKLNVEVTKNISSASKDMKEKMGRKTGYEEDYNGQEDSKNKLNFVLHSSTLPRTEPSSVKPLVVLYPKTKTVTTPNPVESISVSFKNKHFDTSMEHQQINASVISKSIIETAVTSYENVSSPTLPSEHAYVGSSGANTTAFTNLTTERSPLLEKTYSENGTQQDLHMPVSSSSNDPTDTGISYNNVSASFDIEISNKTISSAFDAQLVLHNHTSSSDAKKSLESNHTRTSSKISVPSTSSYSNGEMVPEGASSVDREILHNFTSGLSHEGALTHSATSSSLQPFQHDSASADRSTVLSQTTQPVFNGEISPQSSYNSDTLLLVTPLLSDNQMLLKATPIASDVELVLHATSVFPTVDVLPQPTPSSSSDAYLLKSSSASFNSEVSLHIYTTFESQALLKATPAVTSGKVSLHAALVLSDGDALVQPTLTLSPDVASHQTTSPASETFMFGHRLDIFEESETLPQVSPFSNDFRVHATQELPKGDTFIKPSLTLSSEVIFLQSFPASSDSASFVSDSGGIFLQVTPFVSHTDLLMNEASALSKASAVLQRTTSLPSDKFFGDIPISCGSELLFSRPGSFKEGQLVPMVTSSISLDKLTCISSELVDVDMLNQPTCTLCGDNSLLQVSSVSASEMVSYDTIAPNKSRVMPEHIFSVQHKYTAFESYNDLLIQTTLDVLLKTIFATSELHLSATQELAQGISATLTDDVFLAPTLQSSDEDTLFKPNLTFTVSTKTASVVKDSKLFLDSANEYEKSLFEDKTILHAASVLPTIDCIASLQDLTASLHIETPFPTIFSSSANLLKATVDDYNNVLHQTTPFESMMQPHSTSVFSYPILQKYATPAFTNDETLMSTAASIDNIVYNDIVPPSTSSNSLSNGILFYVPSDFSQKALSVNPTLPLLNSNMYISVTAVPPISESPVTIALSPAPLEHSSVTSSNSSHDGLWPSVLEGSLLIKNDTASVLHAETMLLEDSSAKTYNITKNLTSHYLSVKSRPSGAFEEERFTTNASFYHRNTDMDKTNDPVSTSVSVIMSSQNTNMTVLEKQNQTVINPVKFTKDPTSWAFVASDEESGSGQSTSDNLNDNETSTDFSLPDYSERESHGTGTAEDLHITKFKPRSATPIKSHTVGHKNVSSSIISVTEASNSSHESRIGAAEGLETERKTLIPLVIVSALTFICLVVLIAILIYWRKCFQTAHFYLEDNTSPRVISTLAAPIISVSGVDVESISLKLFPKHVTNLHTKKGFTEEFETLKEFYEEIQSCTVDLGITSDNSNHPDNKNKNRYINIVAYDHSRVKLAHLTEKDGKRTDYINANYVDGYNKQRSYIAAQGPLKSTAEDFWRMVWEHNVEIIVMITNLVEKGRRKCDQYWPSENSEEYGSFLVTLKTAKVLAYYTVRHFTVRNTKLKKGSQKGRRNERIVTQYHYTQWPDMGVPEYVLPLLTFVRKSSAARSSEMNPVIVHCSAGVGRTGTYIVVDSMLKQIRLEGTVNVLGFLKHIRTQRNYLVQTEEQYVFIHDALVEAILSKETEVLASHIHAYVNALLTPGPSGKTSLEKQFKLLSQSNVKQCDYSAALKQCNREKNRSSSVIPVERSRVRLSSVAGEGVDYINASYIKGYHHSSEFIITQHPLLHTTKDFWRMIWDHNAQVIVMLSDNQNLAENECVYWPSKEEPMNCEGFTVSMISEDCMCLSNEENLIIQDFILEAMQDDYVLEVKHYQCPKWPNPDSPISKTFELINIIKEEATTKDGPVIVHDEHGGVTAGTFCALTTLVHQLESENSIDVYQTTKMINLMRPGVFTDIEQYQFLYKAILSLVGTREEENPATTVDSSAVLVDGNNAAESLESLV